MILFSKEEGLIKATGIRKLDGARDANYKLPVSYTHLTLPTIA